MVEVRDCREEDVEPLEAAVPSGGRDRFQAERFRLQQQGHGTFLVAWSDGSPVGSGVILWDGCGAPEVRRRYSCPELNGLVVAEHLRSRGIGTAILHAAEERVRRRGGELLGLGVDDGNPRAAALYLRLGYEETGCHYLDTYHVVDDDGTRHEIRDPARFLVKRL